MNIQKMMKQAAKMQEQLNDALAEKTVAVSVGGEKVTVVANGLGDIISIKIAKEVVDPEDTEMLEDLILSGVKQAIEKGKSLAQSEMGRLTSGLGLAARNALDSFLLNRPVSRLVSLPTTLLSSSVVERSAVNRLVVGSNPTSGAIFLHQGIRLHAQRLSRYFSSEHPLISS